MNTTTITDKEYEEDFNHCVASLKDSDPQSRGGMLKVLAEDSDIDHRFLNYIQPLLKDNKPCLLYVRQYTYAEVRWNAALAFANQHFLLENKKPIIITDVAIPIERHELAILVEEFGIKESRIHFEERNTDGMTDLELQEYHRQEHEANHSPFLEWFTKLNELNLLPVCDLELDQDFPRSTRWMADLARIAYYEDHYDPKYPQIKRVQARRN
jgi:hypothetical protein